MDYEKLKIELPPALTVEVKFYAKQHRITVSEAISRILAIYLRGMKND